MWKKLKDFKYYFFSNYYFFGIILAVLVFQFVTNSISQSGLDFNSLVENEILIYFTSALMGGLVGGLVFLSMVFRDANLRSKEKLLWIKIQEQYLGFVFRNILAFSMGGFVYLLVGNLFDMPSFDGFFQALFSKNFVIEYVGIILAMSVFSLFVSVGTKKRLNLLYGKL